MFHLELPSSGFDLHLGAFHQTSSPQLIPCIRIQSFAFFCEYLLCYYYYYCMYLFFQLRTSLVFIFPPDQAHLCALHIFFSSHRCFFLERVAAVAKPTPLVLRVDATTGSLLGVEAASRVRVCVQYTTFCLFARICAVLSMLTYADSTCIALMPPSADHLRIFVQWEH